MAYQLLMTATLQFFSRNRSINSLAVNQLFSGQSFHILFYQLPVDEVVLVFADTVLNIFSKNIPNKIVTGHDKDAAWITLQVNSAIKRN